MDIPDGLALTLEQLGGLMAPEKKAQAKKNPSLRALSGGRDCEAGRRARDEISGCRSERITVLRKWEEKSRKDRAAEFEKSGKMKR